MFRIPTVPALAYCPNYDGIILYDNHTHYAGGTVESAAVKSITCVDESTAQYYEDALNELYDSSGYTEGGTYYIVLAKHTNDSVYQCEQLYYLQVYNEYPVYVVADNGTDVWWNGSQYVHSCSCTHNDAGYVTGGMHGSSIYMFSNAAFTVRYYNGAVNISDAGKTGSINTVSNEISSGSLNESVDDDGHVNHYINMANISSSGSWSIVSTNMDVYTSLDFCDHKVEDGVNEHSHGESTDTSLGVCCYDKGNCISNILWSEDVDEFINAYGSVLWLEKVYYEGNISETGVTYDASQIALNNFYMMYHDASNFENCYIEFKYNITDYMRENIDQCVIDISSLYEHSAEVLWGADGVDKSEVLSYQTVSLSECSSGFKLYLKDIASVKEVIDRASGIGLIEGIMENMIIGDVTSVDVSSYPIVGDIASTVDGVIEVTYSDLYLELIPRINQSYGGVIRPHVDLLTGEFDYYESIPDDSGNYTDSEKVESEEHYYIDVSQDDFGNDEYTYYIIDENSGLSTQIDGNVSVTVDFAEPLTLQFANSLAGGIAGGSSSSSNSSGGADIDLTIEDDDYSDEQLREDLADGFGLLDDSGTDTKGDGYVNLVADLIDGADNDLGKIIAFGVSSVVGAAIIRAWLRR